MRSDHRRAVSCLDFTAINSYWYEPTYEESYTSGWKSKADICLHY